MRPRALLPLALLATALLAPTALAQPSTAQIEAAKKVAAEAADNAKDAYDAGKFAEAIAGFERADKAFHAPKFQLYVARSQAKMGKLVAAKGTYEAIVAEKIPVFAPPEFFTAQADAKKELAGLALRIPTLLVVGKGGIETATLDGKVIPLGQALSVDPGEHALAGTGGGGAKGRLVVSVQERDEKEVVLEPAPVATSSAGEPGNPSSGGGLFRSMPVPTYVAYGAGAVGLVLGGVFGGLTLAKKGEYDALRGADPVVASQVNAAAEEGRVFSAVTDVAFAVAILGAATGTVIWIVSPKPKEGSTEAKGTGARLFVAPRAGGLTFGGSF